MAQTKCITANVIKNTGSSTIVNAGNVPTNSLVQDFSLIELNTKNTSVYGTKVVQAVSAASSGNLGTLKCLSGSVFSYQEKGKYLIPLVSTTIAGVASTLFQNTANKITQKPNNALVSMHTAYLTAFGWTGGFAGNSAHFAATVSAQAPNFGSDHEITTLGAFAYRTGKPAVVQDTYDTPYSV